MIYLIDGKEISETEAKKIERKNKLLLEKFEKTYDYNFLKQIKFIVKLRAEE